MKLYPQTANGNNLKIEESRLVDKILETQMMINLENSNHKLTEKRVRLQYQLGYFLTGKIAL